MTIILAIAALHAATATSYFAVRWYVATLRDTPSRPIKLHLDRLRVVRRRVKVDESRKYRLIGNVDFAPCTLTR